MIAIKEKSVSTKFGKVYYLESGTGKKIIMFLHGWFGTPGIISDLARCFSSKGYRIIAPYLPGHGPTFRISKNFGFSELAGVMTDFVDRLKLDNMILIGHSLGGSLALEIADKRATKIRKLILSDILFNPKVSFLRTIYNALLDEAKDNLAALINKERNIVHQFRTKPPHFLSMPKLWRLTKTVKTNHLFNKKIPILFLWGNNDSVVPLKENLENIRKIPNHKLKLFSGCHHWNIRYFKSYLKTIEDFCLD